MEASNGNRGGRVGRRSTAVLGVVLAGVALGIANVSAATPSQALPPLPGGSSLPWDVGATAVEARPDLVDVRPRRWEQVLLAQDGRTATVYFRMGPDTCEGLAGIEVAATDAGYRILVLTGDVPGASIDCPVASGVVRTTVTLDDRVITGGGLLDLPGGRAALGG
jgi:hypothetical protein